MALSAIKTEVKRLLGVLETRLQGQEYLVQEGYTIADMATFPWVGALDWGYNAVELLQNFPNVVNWYERCRQRPTAARGLEVTKLT